MKIPVILNNEKTIIDAAPDERLLDVLRRYKILSVKEGCGKGTCGFCTVLLDKRPVPSCIIPAGLVRDASIETLESFSKTKPGIDILKGFDQAGMTLCGYCNAQRVFSTYALLERTYRPSAEELDVLADSITCTCTDRKTFINGVLYATANKHEREGRKNGLV